MKTPQRLVVPLLVPGIGHYRHGQLEVRGQLGRHGDFQFVLAFAQLHEFVVQHSGALEGYQRQGRGLPPVQLHRGGVAHLVSMLVGQDPQPHLVLVVGDLHHKLTRDGVLEPVGPLGPQDVTPSLLELQRLPRRAVLLGRLQLVLLDQPLADLALYRGPFEHFQRELPPRRLALGVVGGNRGLERLAGHVDRPDGPHADRKPLGGQHEVHRRL